MSMKPSLRIAQDILDLSGSPGVAMNCEVDDDGKNLPVVRIDRFAMPPTWAHGADAVLLIRALEREGQG